MSEQVLEAPRSASTGKLASAFVVALLGLAELAWLGLVAYAIVTI